MKNKEKQYQKLNNALPVITLTVTIAIFTVLYIGINHKEWLIPTIASSNLLIYIFSFIVGAAVFIILRILFLHFPFHRKTIAEYQFSPKISAIITFLLCGITAILFIRRRFVDEYYEYPARDIPYKSFHLLPGIIAILLILIIGFILLLLYQNFENKKPLKVLTWIAYAFSICFVYSFLSTPTLDNNSSFDVYHGTAYIQSIYNALYYIPYNLETTGVYGHYGIFYAIIMRLFHLQSEDVFTLISLAGAITTICCAYIIHNLIQSDYLRFTAAISLAVPQALVYNTNYWMTYPHKTLFPMILIAWLLFVFQHSGRDENILKQKIVSVIFLLTTYLISTIGIVWNTETGLYCLVCTAAAFIIYGWQKHQWLSPYMLIRYVIHAVLCVLSVAGAYGIVLLFNIYCGGRFGISTGLSLNEFFFPLGILNTFVGSGEHADVIFGNHAWIYVLLLFLITGFYALEHTTVFSFSEVNNDKIPVIAAIALLGIMHFALYFEHAAYGKLSMCLLPAVIAIAYLCDRHAVYNPFKKGGAAIKDIFSNTFSIMGLLTLTILTAEVLTIGPISIGLHGYRDQGKSDIHHLASLYNSVVPPDTFSIGSCVDVLNYQLHQESNAHYREFPNLNLGNINVSERIINDALTHDYFSVWDMGNGEKTLLAKILESDPTYTLAREIDLGGYPLQVYSRIEELP